MGPTALLPLRRKFGFEPATGYPVGPVASTLTAGPPRAANVTLYELQSLKNGRGAGTGNFESSDKSYLLIFSKQYTNTIK
jgi:hypothetical protein